MEETTIAAAVVAVAHLAKPVVETACKFAESLLGEPMKVAGGMLADQIYAWQLTNRVTIVSKAKALCEKKKIEPRRLATGFLLPYFAAAGNVDNPDLQDLWARLLASAVESDDAQHPLFVRTLEGMSAEDAELLHKLCMAWKPVTAFFKIVDGVPSEGEPAVWRMISLNVLAPDMLTRRPGQQQYSRIIYVTGFGAQFIQAVMPEVMESSTK